MVKSNKKNNQNAELFKFFEKSKKRKTSPKNKGERPFQLRLLPAKRTRRLRTEIFVETFKDSLPDGEYAINSEEFNSSQEQVAYGPEKKKIKLSDNTDSFNEVNMYCNENEEINESSNNTNNSTPGKDDYKGARELAEDMIDSIDTNVIFDMIKDTCMDKEECQESNRKEVKIPVSLLSKDIDNAYKNNNPKVLLETHVKSTKKAKIKKLTKKVKGTKDSIRANKFTPDELNESVILDKDTNVTQSNNKGLEKFDHNDYFADDNSNDINKKNTITKRSESLKSDEILKQTEEEFQKISLTANSDDAEQHKRRSTRANAKKLNDSKLGTPVGHNKSDDFENAESLDQTKQTDLDNNETIHLIRTNKITQEPKKRGRKSNEKLDNSIKTNNVLDEADQQNTKNTNLSYLEKTLSQNDLQTSSTTNTNERNNASKLNDSDLATAVANNLGQTNQTDLDSNDNNNLVKIKIIPPRKRGRKSNAEKFENLIKANNDLDEEYVIANQQDKGNSNISYFENTLNHNDLQTSITTTEKDFYKTTQTPREIVKLNSLNGSLKEPDNNEKSSSLIELDNKEISSKTTQKPIETKKRGRKPKCLYSSLKEPVNNEKSSSLTEPYNKEMSSKTAQNPVEVKKRGRNPKCLNSLLKEPDNNEKSAFHDRNIKSLNSSLKQPDNNEKTSSLLEPDNKEKSSSLTEPDNNENSSSLTEPVNKEISSKTAQNNVETKKRGRKPKGFKGPLQKPDNKKTSSNKDKGIMRYFSAESKSETNNDSTYSPPKNKLKQNEKSTLSRDQQKPEKPRVVKVNVAKEFYRQTYTKVSKLTKEQIKQNSAARKIPEERLNEVLEMMDDDDHPMWEDRNISCNPCIHQYWDPRSHTVSDQNIKLKYARQFILRRNWVSLAKVLCLSNSEANGYYYPLLSKYAALLLAHTEKEQFDKFLQFLISINDSSAVIKKCTKIAVDNEE